MRRKILIVAVLVVIIAGLFLARRETKVREEAELRQTLMDLRSAISDYTLRHDSRPRSLSDLISDGYFKTLPTDPITGRSDTWQPVLSPAGDGIDDVRSGSDVKSTRGRPYNSW